MNVCAALEFVYCTFVCTAFLVFLSSLLGHDLGHFKKNSPLIMTCFLLLYSVLISNFRTALQMVLEDRGFDFWFVVPVALQRGRMSSMSCPCPFCYRRRGILKVARRLIKHMHRYVPIVALIQVTHISVGWSILGIFSEEYVTPTPVAVGILNLCSFSSPRDIKCNFILQGIISIQILRRCQEPLGMQSIMSNLKFHQTILLERSSFLTQCVF